MKRSNKSAIAQSLLQFPAVSHDVPRLAIAINRRMRNGTAHTTVNKSGLVFSGIKKPQKGSYWNKIVFSKNPLNIKRYLLSDKPGDDRYYPAFMSDSVKVRLLVSEFSKELPLLVAQLRDYCSAIIDQEETIQLAWPARYIHNCRKWLCQVKRINTRLADHRELITDPAAFSRILVRGNFKPVVIDFMLKYKARFASKKFTRLVKQFFM